VKPSAVSTIDEYILHCPAQMRKRLKELRALIARAAPAAEERISYRMPCFYLDGVLVYFAAHARHIGFYPTPSGISAFRRELAAYECSKGAVQLPLEKALPTALLRKIILFRKSENEAASAARAAKKTPRARHAGSRATGSR